MGKFGVGDLTLHSIGDRYVCACGVQIRNIS